MQRSVSCGLVARVTARAMGTVRLNPEGRIERKPQIEVVVEPTQDAKRISLCRCWLSKKMPYCDDSHKKHNEANKDVLGPVVIIVKPAAAKQ